MEAVLLCRRSEQQRRGLLCDRLVNRLDIRRPWWRLPSLCFSVYTVPKTYIRRDVAAFLSGLADLVLLTESKTKAAWAAQQQWTPAAIILYMRTWLAQGDIVRGSTNLESFPSHSLRTPEPTDSTFVKSFQAQHPRRPIQPKV